MCNEVEIAYFIQSNSAHKSVLQEEVLPPPVSVRKLIQSNISIGKKIKNKKGDVRLATIASQPTCKRIQIASSSGGAVSMCATEIRIKVLMNIEDEVGMTAIKVCHCA